jgi:hypothetical protein
MNEEQILDKLNVRGEHDRQKAKIKLDTIKRNPVKLNNIHKSSEGLYVILGEGVFKAAKYLIERIDHKRIQQADIDKNWKIKGDDESKLLSTAVFWLFCWADTQGKNKGAPELFEWIFEVSYEHFYQLLDEIEPAFKNTAGSVRRKLRKTDAPQFANKTLEKIIERLYPITTANNAGEQNTDNSNPVDTTQSNGGGQDNPVSPLPPNTNTDDDDGNPTPPADAKPRKPVQLSVPARNPKNVQEVKKVCGNKCQVCDKVVELDYHGKYYSECHHVVPLSYADKPTAFEGKFEGIKGDLDVIQNMICVCPNCHAKLHYGTLKLNVNLEKHEQHPIKKVYIEYYNTLILPDNMTRYTRDTTTQDKYDPFDAVVVDETISNMESP